MGRQQKVVEKFIADGKVLLALTHHQAVGEITDAREEAARAAIDALDKSTRSAQRVIDAAERLQHRFGWGVVGNMSLALVPLATALAMFVLALGIGVNAIGWVLA